MKTKPSTQSQKLSVRLERLERAQFSTYRKLGLLEKALEKLEHRVEVLERPSITTTVYSPKTHHGYWVD